MKLKSVPASQGLQWVRDGFKTLARRPMAFVGLASAFVFVMALAIRFAWLLMLFVAALPMISLGFMNAARLAHDRGTTTLAAFFAPWRAGRPTGVALLRMTFAYVGASVVIGLLTSWAYGDAFSALVASQTQPPPHSGSVAEHMADPRLATGMLVQLGLATLLSVPFWHAPPLIHWGGQGLAQALFSSTVAIWRNRGAFVVYALAFAALVFAFTVAGGLLFALFGTGPLVAMLALSVSLVIPAAFYASLYWTFVGCFDIIDPLAPAPTPP